MWGGRLGVKCPLPCCSCSLERVFMHHMMLCGLVKLGPCCCYERSTASPWHACRAGSAEADARSVETIAAQRQRIAELEGHLGLLQRQLAAARHQCESTESRLAAAEVAAARAAAEVRVLLGSAAALGCRGPGEP